MLMDMNSKSMRHRADAGLRLGGVETGYVFWIRPSLTSTSLGLHTAGRVCLCMVLVA